ncbi:hypothetical protein BCR35DRAFT_18082 [Leucosporidium creatinivorum]|uniref:Uncharacterized protein n=1 Tax=Leucosporidium creatinivorum TaxID=106004 RepID=A0A1Y2D2Q4_9BASI|nr:hypothetical protein BCR35DRAFT_18082 [Leucosporidium creatinivorum]
MGYITRLIQRLRPAFAVKQYSTRPAIAVDSLCIPLSPPYSLASYLPTQPTPLSRQTLLHLHRLSALQPPQTEEEWKELDDLNGLAAIIEGIRMVRLGEGAAEGEMVDARVRGEATELLDRPRRKEQEQEEQENDPAFGRRLLDLAEVKEGSYYTAPTPSNVRGKKRGGSSSASSVEEE